MTMDFMEKRGEVLYIEPSDFAFLLRSRINQDGGKIAPFARKLGISRPLLYALLEGNREPSQELLAALGGRYVIRIDGEADLRPVKRATRRRSVAKIAKKSPNAAS